MLAIFALDRDQTLEKVQREEKSRGRVRYTITFYPKVPHLPNILSNNWKVMTEADPRLGKAFPAPPMACLKRGPNLQDKLVRARLPPIPDRPGTRAAAGPRPGITSCKARRRKCCICPYTGAASDRKTVVREVKINHSGQVLSILQPISCRDSYCLYILTCTKPGCGKQYAGQTHRQLYLRFG